MRPRGGSRWDRALVRTWLATGLGFLLGLVGPPQMTWAQWTDNGDKLTTTDSVGIGTPIPGAKLDVQGGSVNILTNNAAGGGLNLGTGNFAGRLWIDGSNVILDSANPNGDIYIRPGGSGRSIFLDIGKVIMTGGNVGIGTPSPAGKLTIGGAGGSAATDGIEWYSGPGNASGYSGWAGRAYIGTPTGSWATAPFIFAVPNTTGGEIQTMTLLNGNVGIGTTGPSDRLSVRTATDNNLHFRSNSSFGDSLTTGIWLDSVNDAYTLVRPLRLRGSSIILDGNVGIGTTSPTRSLHVVGAGQTGYFGSASGAGIVFQDNAGVAEVLGINSANNAFNPIQLRTAASPALYVNTGGNVGIGTTGPVNSLHIKNDTAAAGDSPHLLIQSGTTATVGAGGVLGLGALKTAASPIANATIKGGVESAETYNGYLAFGVRNGADYAINREMMRINSSGNVGIGTTGPGERLDVEGSVQFGATSGGRIAEVQPNVYLDALSGGGGVGLRPGGGTTAALFATPAGNVGIGRSNPEAKLHVAGDVIADGNLAAKYQDIAEWVPTPHALVPGMVVVLDRTHPNQVIPSEQAYDTRVAGVVTNSPGLLLGEAGQGKVKVATTGRVKVKARGPIQIGELLVTSDQDGLAMRSEPLELDGTPVHRPGTIIGKALESLEEGEGEILVLLTLQ